MTNETPHNTKKDPKRAVRVYGNEFTDWDVAPDGCEDMASPFRCRWCSAVYDLGHVEVIARYSDCSVWKAPCCRNTADDRDPRWGGGGTKLKRRTGPVKSSE